MLVGGYEIEMRLRWKEAWGMGPKMDLPALMNEICREAPR